MKKVVSLLNKQLHNHFSFVRLLYWCGIVAFFLFSFYTMHLSIWTLIRTFLFMIFGVLLPGYLFARQTARMDQTAELYAFCLFFGISISIIAYFCDAFIGNPLLDRTIFSFCLGPALSIPSCFLLANDIYGHRLEKSTLIPDSILRNIVVVALIISFFSMALKSGISARIVGVSTTYHDVLWNIGNLAALDHGWPADNLQYFGKYLNSNIFAIIFPPLDFENMYIKRYFIIA